MKELPRIFGLLIGGLSLFKLITLLFNWELSAIMEFIIDQYNYVLKPIKAIFTPLFTWIANLLKFELPYWWPHFFVIWILLGAVTVRAGEKIDKKTGQEKKINFFLEFVSYILLPAVRTLFSNKKLLYFAFSTGFWPRLTNLRNRHKSKPYPLSTIISYNPVYLKLWR